MNDDLVNFNVELVPQWIPEPTTGALLVVAVLGFLIWRAWVACRR